MKRLLPLLLCVTAFVTAGWSQQNNDRSNEMAGVDIDRFIGFAENSPVHLSHGTLLTHSILREGDPYSPGPNGAVLEYRKDVSVVTLLARNRTRCGHPRRTLPGWADCRQRQDRLCLPQ